MSDRELIMCVLSFVGGGSLGMGVTAWFARREWQRLRDAVSAALADADE